MSEHHPSCRPSDKDLVWLCAQCGAHEPVEPSEAKAFAALTADALGYEPQRSEWTPERIERYVSRQEVVELADDINAALAAAVESAVVHPAELITKMGKLEQQLATERAETEAWKRNGANAVAGLERELAAERERWKKAQDELVGIVAAERQLVQWCEVHAPTKDEPITCCPCCEAVQEVKLRDQTIALGKQVAGELGQQLAVERQRTERAQTQVNELNNLLREAGWGQGEIDSAATIAEENERLRRELEAELQEIDSEAKMQAALDAALKPYKDGWLDQAARDSVEIVRLENALAEVEQHNIAGTISPEALAKHDAEVLAKATKNAELAVEKLIDSEAKMQAVLKTARGLLAYLSMGLDDKSEPETTAKLSQVLNQIDAVTKGKQ